MSDEDEELRPGFASEDPAEEEPRPVLMGNLKIAHYDGATAEEAEAMWQAETLCLSCVIADMCKVAQGTREPLVVISRCLSYIPAG